MPQTLPGWFGFLFEACNVITTNRVSLYRKETVAFHAETMIPSGRKLVAKFDRIKEAKTKYDHKNQRAHESSHIQQTTNMPIQLATNFKPADIKVGGVEKTKKGGKIVYLSNQDGSRILLQTPAMPLPFGLTPYEVGGDIQSYSLDLSFRNADTDPKVQAFLDMVKGLDTFLVDLATERSEEWFGKKQSRELVAEFYRRVLNDKRAGEYPPTVKTKVSVNAMGEPTAQFFDEERQPTTIDHLTKGSSIKTIVELSSVWFVNKTYGVTFRVSQAQVVYKPSAIGTAYAFQADDASQGQFLDD